MKNQVINEVGRKIRELRKLKGITQETLAEKSELSLVYMNLLENGRRNISLDNLVKILNVLEISLSDFFKSDSIEDEELSNLIDLLQISDKKDEYIDIFTKIMNIKK